MDFSKLPKLSQSPAPPEQAPVEATPPAQVVSSSPVQPLRVTPGVGAEVWLSAVVGVVCLLLGRNFARYWMAKLTGREFQTGVFWTAGPNAGKEVNYLQLEGGTAWNDAAIFLFGLALVFEAALLAVVYSRFRFKMQLVMVSFLITVLATGFNAVVAVVLLNKGVLPLWSALAVAYGGYIAAYEWRLMQFLSPAPAQAPRPYA